MRKSKYFRIPLPKKVAKLQWSGKENNWVKNHPYAFEINNKIREKVNLVVDMVKRSYLFNKPLSFAQIFEQLHKKHSNKTFYNYMENFIKKPPEKLAPNTLKKYATCLAHLKEFKPELFFYDIDNSLIMGFNKYMNETLGLVGSSRKKYMDALKRVIRAAKKDQFMDENQVKDLFEDVKIKIGPSKRTFMEVDDIKKWKQLHIPETRSYLTRDQNMYLFQLYSGLYYKDLQIIKKSQLINDSQYGLFLVGERDKNGNQTIVPLFKFPYSLEILRKYGTSEDQEYVFDRSCFVEEPVYNRNLKEIASLAGITRKITNKIARHTNAQLWVRYGADRPVLSAMLGHTKEETTKNYYDINLTEIYEGTKRADFIKLGL